MEVNTLKTRLANLFLKAPLPFTKKRDFNWNFILKSFVVGLIGGVIVILILPPPQKEQKIFYHKSEVRPQSVDEFSQAPRENNPTEDTLAQLQGARGQANSVPRSIGSLYLSSPFEGGQSANRNSSMIIARAGLDAKTQLPPGTKFEATLVQATSVDGQTIPIIATVTSDVAQEDGTIAIPQGSKLYGEASFDDNSERVQATWKSVQLPNGILKSLAAITVGSDSQIGIEGDVHSDSLKNSVGQTLTRFIGAYAEGSMQRGALGSNEGGEANGLRNAISETAKEHANAWGEDMKKKRKWIELKAGESFFVLLTEAFQFREAGATYER